MLIDSNLDELIETVQPRTIIDCVAYGAYSFETDSQLIYETNFSLVSRLLARLESRKIAALSPRRQFLGIRRQCLRPQ